MENPNESDVPSGLDRPSPEEQLLSGAGTASQAFEPDYRLPGEMGLDAEARELLNEERSEGSEETARQSASSRDPADVGSLAGPVVARVGEAGPTSAPARMPSSSGGMRMEVDDVELIPDYSQLPEHPAVPSSWTGRVAPSHEATGSGSGPLDSLSGMLQGLLAEQLAPVIQNQRLLAERLERIESSRGSMSQDSVRAEPRLTAAPPGIFPSDAGLGSGVMGACSGAMGFGTAASGFGGGLSSEMVAELNRQQFLTPWWQFPAQCPPPRLPEHLRQSNPIGSTGRADVGVATLGAEGGMGAGGIEGPSLAGQGRTAEATPRRGAAVPAESGRASQCEGVGALSQGVSLSEVTARPAAATVSSGPPVEEALRVVVAALCVASVKGEPLSEGSDDFGFWRVILLWSVLVILVWEIVKWGCRVSCRRFVLPDMPEPDSEASQSEREQEPDDEDLLVETDRPQVTAEPLDEDPGVMPFRYADDVVYLVPRRPTIAYHTEPEQQVLEQAGIRRRHALRVYAPEPDDEPLPQVRGVGSDDVPREAERVVRVSDLAPLPSFQEGGPLRRLVEARERAEVLQGMLNMPPMVPIVLHPFWPAPPQLTVRELRTMASEWGGPASSLYQEPHPAYHGDQYIYVPDVRPRVLVRWHMRPRVGLFHPEQAPTPIPLGALTGQRRTLQGFANGDRVIWDDRFTNPDPERPHENLWRGRTELEVDPDELARLQGGNEDSD
ncbi:GIP [Symbiodinium sp. CCMP2592]|nr:GIP [Symbiodinium sp. CCMP2592]